MAKRFTPPEATTISELKTGQHQVLNTSPTAGLPTNWWDMRHNLTVLHPPEDCTSCTVVRSGKRPDDDVSASRTATISGPGRIGSCAPDASDTGRANDHDDASADAQHEAGQRFLPTVSLGARHSPSVAKHSGSQKLPGRSVLSANRVQALPISVPGTLSPLLASPRLTGSGCACIA